MPRPRLFRYLVRHLAQVAVLLLWVPILWVPKAARAHAILMDSTPVLSGTVAAGNTGITLRFNSRIDAGRSRLLLIRPDGSQAVLPLSPDPQPDRLVSKADLTPGDYVVRWQVLAVDGHITRGNVPFTVKAP